MKILIAISALAATFAVACKSKPKYEAPVVPAAAIETQDMLPAGGEPLNPITPADLGANSSGLGL